MQIKRFFKIAVLFAIFANCHLQFASADSRVIRSCSEALSYFESIYSEAGLLPFERVSNTCEENVTSRYEAMPKYIAASIRFTIVPRGGVPLSPEEFQAYQAALQRKNVLLSESQISNQRSGPPEGCPYHASSGGNIGSCVSRTTGRTLYALSSYNLNVGSFQELEYLFSSAPPTPTPTPTPDKCLSEEDADDKVYALLGTPEDFCDLGDASPLVSEISKIDETRCKPKEGHLPTGVTLDKLFHQSVNLGQNNCSDALKRVILYAGYRLKGSNRNLKELLVSSENGWSCFRPEDKEGKKGSIHPYKLGVGSKVEEAVVIIEGKGSEKERALVAERALNELPPDYPLDVTLKGNIVVKSPTELYSELLSKRLTEKDYAEILTQIPRANVSFDAYGAVSEGDSGIVKTQRISFGESMSRSWICTPPKRPINNDQCTDLSLSDDCLARLAKAEGLEKGKQVRNKKGKLEPQYLPKYLAQYPPQNENNRRLMARVKPFIKVAIHAAYINGFRGKDLKTFVAIMGEEGTYNYYVLNPYGRDYSFGDCQYNVKSKKRKAAVLAEHGTLDVLYSPKINLAYCRGLYNGGGLRHWSAYTNGRYQKFVQVSNQLVNEYLAEIKPKK